MAMEVRPLSTALGAEVLGADLSRPGDDQQFEVVQKALLDHNVVVIRDQQVSPMDHVTFSRRFGELEHHVLRQFLLPNYPEILLVSNKRIDGKPIGIQDAGKEWHTDLSYMDIPSLGSLLYAREIPPSGGDTLFANLVSAYQALSVGMKDRIGQLRARHSFENYTNRRRELGGAGRSPLTPGQVARVPTATHPLVRTHPETGRKLLFLSPGLTVGIEDMDEVEGTALLQELNAHATQSAFVYRHQWCENDVVFWDNRCTIHLATPFDPQYTRHMHRTTISGIPTT